MTSFTLWEFEGLECMSVFKGVTALNHFHQLPIFVLQCGSKIGSYARSGSAVYNFTSIFQLTFFHVSVGGSTHMHVVHDDMAVSCNLSTVA